MARPLPIARVSDNVPAGKEPGGFAREFALIFRREIANRFINDQETPCADPVASTDSPPLDCA